MDVVPSELNSILPDEIMDTEAIVMEDSLPVASPAPAPSGVDATETSVSMETEVPEIFSLCSTATSTQMTLALTTPTTTDSVPCTMNSGTQLLLTPSVSSSQCHTPAPAPKPTTLVAGGLQKLSAPFTLSANHQLILNKVGSSSGVDAKSHGTPLLKHEGQKLVVTTISKGGQPIVLTLPHTAAKPGTVVRTGDATVQPQQFKVVAIGGRTELKPVVGVQTVSTASQLGSSSPQTASQNQQLKTVQITKKTVASTAGPMVTKFIITKALSSKGLSSQTSVSPVLTGRVLGQGTPVTPPRTIAIADTLNSASQSVPTSKVAISPLMSPSKLTVVSMASPSPGSPQKTVSLPLSVALGQQILAVQQPTSPAKAAPNQSTSQTVKPVQTVAVGGVGTSQFKTIFPLAATPSVQQIQVPGSRFHYVRLVTATTASGTAHNSSPSINSASSQPAKPLVVNTAPMRMSVPIVPAQTVKQVVPKPLNSTAQVVPTQTQQRLIMPATPLPQIQPNLTNLPPGTVLTSAPGVGNVGYAVLPAQYVTQLQQSSFVTLASSASYSTTTGIQTQARMPLNGTLSVSESTTRPRKPCNCTKSQCLKLYCDCFANGEFCSNCNCTNCFNNLEHESERLKAIKACLDRNPEAFKPKIGKGKEGESDRRHSKGCNCKRSGCLKNYCECYEAKIMCSSICKCVGCKNFEESPERKTLMHLADAAEVRVQQQTAAKTKLSSQISDLLTRTTPALPCGGGRLPYTFVTKEVAEATCDCLMEQAEQAELSSQPQAVAERVILEEFGRCLMRIISSAGGV
ncbi:protein lin-54 homolog isoform X2 [Denticeps clupeoides]|uniref:CRC domain-containing protein n=1 Tax=Denticeps clupeoides TaxID=299321 RepID=A0AAY4DIW8_9TELE|nr:protein lin-54 homolog isoform X2 [Denticeps clupeoides]